MASSISVPPGAAPTITSGFGGATGRSITGNGRAFTIVCGNNGADDTGVLAMPAGAINGWTVLGVNQTAAGAAATGGPLYQAAGTTASVSLANYDRADGTSLIFASGDVLKCIAEPY